MKEKDMYSLFLAEIAKVPLEPWVWRVTEKFRLSKAGSLLHLSVNLLYNIIIPLQLLVDEFIIHAKHEIAMMEYEVSNSHLHFFFMFKPT